MAKSFLVQTLQLQQEIFRQKAVDKVQVFDKTSKMEEMTVFRTMRKFKAINLTLKDEYKKDILGKLLQVLVSIRFIMMNH
jgi:hypothetical protein